MADFDPDKYLAKKQPFNPDAYLRKATGAEPGSPLAKALAEQTGDVVTVETPEGPARFDRQGRRVMSFEDMPDIGSNRIKTQAMQGVLSVASGGGPLLDEGYGALKALGSIGTPEKFGDAYERGLGEARREVAQATRAVSPNVNVGGVDVPVLPVLGAAIPGLVAPVAATGLARIALSGGQSAYQAAGQSESDLTKGDFGGFAKNVGAGAGIGLLAGGAGEAVGVPLRALASRLGSEAGAARQATQEAIQTSKDKAVASAAGQVGRVVATQGNSMETVMDVLRNPQWYSDDVVQEAWRLAESPEGKLLLSRAAANNIDKLRQSLSAETVAREGLASANQAASPAAVAAATAEKVAPESLRADLAGRAWRSLGQRAALGFAGGAAGRGLDMLTGNDGNEGGFGGALIGATLAPGGLQMMRNVAASPAFQTGANSYMQRLVDGATRVAPWASRTVPQAAQGAAGAVRGDRQLSEEEDVAVRAFLHGG